MPQICGIDIHRFSQDLPIFYKSRNRLRFSVQTQLSFVSIHHYNEFSPHLPTFESYQTDQSFLAISETAILSRCDCCIQADNEYSYPLEVSISALQKQILNWPFWSSKVENCE